MGRTRSIAQMAGEDLVKDLSLPIDPVAIAKGEDIEVIAKEAAAGVSGMFIRVGDAYIIAYATHIASQGFRHFSIAHELGHYFLPGHVDHLLSDGDVHRSSAQFRSKDPHEVEADQFAVGLLMPTKQFKDALQSAPEGLEGVEELARRCDTSLVATAIRMANLTTTPMAIVVSGQDDIEYCVMSSTFSQLPGLTWLERRVPLPKKTGTYAFVGEPGRILGGERAETTTHIDEWFGSGPDLRLVEQIVGLGNYGKVLTVLSLEDDVDLDELGDDEELEESWTPRFKK